MLTSSVLCAENVLLPSTLARTVTAILLKSDVLSISKAVARDVLNHSNSAEQLVLSMDAASQTPVDASNVHLDIRLLEIPASYLIALKEAREFVRSVKRVIELMEPASVPKRMWCVPSSIRTVYAKIASADSLLTRI